MMNSFHATFDRRARRPRVAPPISSARRPRREHVRNLPTTSSSPSAATSTSPAAPARRATSTSIPSRSPTISRWIKGPHQFAFGVDAPKSSSTRQLPAGQRADYLQRKHDRRRAGRPDDRPHVTLANGNALPITCARPCSRSTRRTPSTLTQHLTLNLGIRWEPSLPSYDKYGRGNQFSMPDFIERAYTAPSIPAPAGLLFATDPQNPNGKTFTQAHWTGLLPARRSGVGSLREMGADDPRGVRLDSRLRPSSSTRSAGPPTLRTPRRSP